MAYILKVLSPVHIHSGEVLKAMTYMVKDDKVLIFNEIDVIKSVKESELLNDELLRSFATTASKRKEYYKTLDYYINKGIIEEAVAEKYKDIVENHVNDLSGQEIYRTMINILGPYIPGSTLKGLVRTAIIYDCLLKKGIDYLKGAVRYLNSRNGRGFSVDDYILYEILDNGKMKKNIYQDPFKFMGIKDINMVEKRLGVYKETIFNITKFQPGNVIEAIEAGDYSEEFDFEIRVNEKLANSYNTDIIKYFKEEELLRVLHQYSKDIIQEEIEYFKKYKHPSLNTKEIVESLELMQDKNSIETPVIRIGKGKGYKSNTVGLAIKKMDKDYYLKEIKNIANPYKYDNNYEFPKTRKFVSSQLSPKLLGFAILEKVEG
ncbi:MAG: type III-A CRISPR-associated RAMP protein Csm5 [Tissierellia bacterium]|nr:type III-A CRISPR-associated RAMP protein Csm5 [Tissierellia bacterium]